MDNALASSSCDHPIGPQAYPGHLAQCSHCKTREKHLTREAKLRRCAGCSVVKYCSRECQKAAWPEHKLSCHTARDCSSNGLAGYPAPIALAQAISDWADGTHGCAFQILANAMVCAHGGIGVNLASRVLLFTLAPGDVPGGAGNPAEAFRLVDINIADKEDMPEAWEYVQSERRRKTQYFRKRHTERTVLGVMPAMSRVGFSRSGVYTYHFYPVFALKCHSKEPLPRFISEIFSDVASLCIDTMNSGAVMRPSTVCLCCQPHPDFGILVQQGKKWEWERLVFRESDGDEEQFDGADALVPVTKPIRSGTRTGLPIVKIWEIHNAV